MITVRLVNNNFLKCYFDIQEYEVNLSISPLPPGLTPPTAGTEAYLIPGPAPACNPLDNDKCVGRAVGRARTPADWLVCCVEGLFRGTVAGSVGRMYCTWVTCLPLVGGVREAAGRNWGWSKGRGKALLLGAPLLVVWPGKGWGGVMSWTVDWFGNDPPITKPVTKPPCPTGLGEVAEKYPPPAIAPLPAAPPPPTRSLGFPSGDGAPRNMPPSAGLLDIAMGALVTGLTTFVTTVGAVRTVPGNCNSFGSDKRVPFRVKHLGTCPDPPSPISPPSPFPSFILSHSSPASVSCFILRSALYPLSSVSLFADSPPGDESKRGWTNR